MDIVKKRLSSDEIAKRHEKLKEEIMTQKGIWKHVYLHGQKPARVIQSATRGMQTRKKKWIHKLSTQRANKSRQSIKLYLPDGKNNSNVKPYSSSIKWVYKWLNNPDIRDILIHTSDIELDDKEKVYDDDGKKYLPEIITLKQIIKECTIEIIKDKIKTLGNVIDSRTKTCLHIAAFLLACKVILQYDHSQYDSRDFIVDMLYIINSNCNVNQIEKMELDLLHTTNWRTCYKTQLRHGNIPLKNKNKARRLQLYGKLLRVHQKRFDKKIN